MHFLSSLILFSAFTFFATIQASPVHLELLNSRDNADRDISVEAVRNEIVNLVELPERRDPIAGPPSAGW